MLFSKTTTCPVCHKKVKKSDLQYIETSVGTVVACCSKCVPYLKIRKKINV